MLLLQQHQDGLRRRLHVIGIPAYAIDDFVSLMVKWENGSGIEWTIKRLKSLKVDLIRRRSNLPPLTWVRKNRKGDVAGTIGSLFRWSDKSERNFSKVVQAFMAYTFYIFPKATASQERKFLEAVTTSKPHNLSDEFRKEFIKTVARSIPVCSTSFEVEPLVVYQGSPGKKAPLVFNDRSVRQDLRIPDELRYFDTTHGVSVFRRYSTIYRSLLSGFKHRVQTLDAQSEAMDAMSIPRNDGVPALGGSIHFLQEPGGKLRSIASPFRIHQMALRPLGRKIYDVVQQLPWDCTFDQTKAHPHIMSCLRQGGKVHSTDLSSATDYFPLDLQLDVLRTIFPKALDHISLFKEISRGNWDSPLGRISWSRGQPLGLYPSFGAFTLTHGLLLLHLAGSFKNQFFVVGDDVVILDDNLNKRYRSMLDMMSCPWSPEKSISSNTLSEFAGKIVTSSKVYPQLKWRRMSNDNFLDICRLLGKKSRCLLSDRQKAVFDKVAHLCEPIGLNFSYPGSSLQSMIEETLSWVHGEERYLASLMGLGRKFNSMNYTSSENFDADELASISQTFDEKVARVLASTVFSRWSSLGSTSMEAIELVPSALEQGSRLPLKISKPTRITELERYEQMPGMKA